MKSTLNLLFVFVILGITCGGKIEKKRDMEVFKLSNGGGNANYVELFKNAGSAAGYFYGVESIHNSNKSIYYKGELGDLSRKGNEISFTLERIVYSYTPFYGALNKEDYSSAKEFKEVPILLQSSVKYSGRRDGDTL
ncbi:MAG TPA: hypothetical protein VFR58_11205, partial [Flavisolibacter sp.]|nr:hypothetical protein [Flavisolibacter sp.]